MSKVVVVGGVAGGATAATRVRRLDESADVIMFERGPYVSYANCGLPYHIGEVVTDREALLVSTPEKLKAEYNIDVRTGQEVVSIDRQRQEVSVRQVGNGKTYHERYDKLILSPGARPFIPPVPGVDLPGVFQLRSVPDMDAIKAQVDSGRPRSAVVVGGGFIGLEMADNLALRGLDVAVVEMLDQVMMPLDPEMASLVHQHLRLKNVRLALGDGLKGIASPNGQLAVTLASGKTLLADMVVLSVGVRPDSDLAKDAGLELGPRGHIAVDEAMRTSDPNIYAVGDAVQVQCAVAGGPTAVPLAGPANRQARIAADNVAGLRSAYRGVQGTSIVKVFDITVGTTGLNAKQLSRNGTAFRSVVTQNPDHASYYPGAAQMMIKALYSSETGRLLGAQVVGTNGVDRTIDVLATALAAGMTVYDLEHLELAYSPQYSSAKDPVNIVGFVAANDLRGDTDIVHWDEVATLDPEQDVVLDVRTDLEASLGTVSGAVHMPVENLREGLADLDRSKRHVVFCKMGRRGYIAERILRQNGFKAANLTGGYDLWAAATAKQDNFDEWKTKGATTMTQAAQKAVAAPALAGEYDISVELDACGLQCPGPVMAVFKQMQDLQPGQVLRVKATDPGFARDIGAWCESTGNTLLDLHQEGPTLIALVSKGDAPPKAEAVTSSVGNAKERTLVVFSGDFDRAIAAFILANGAIAAGEKVTMFFTFWGLNILRRDESVAVKKNVVERMFGMMMPRGAKKLSLSKMNMAGMGTAMMKQVMKAKNVDALPALIEMARQNGVRLIGCQMTMDIMGIKAEELIDGVEIGGVATYTAASDKAHVNLFV